MKQIICVFFLLLTFSVCATAKSEKEAEIRTYETHAPRSLIKPPTVIKENSRRWVT